MRVFLTGGNGFIGSAVVRQLLGSGHVVVCLLRRTSRTDRIDNLPVERVPGDVHDVDSLRAGARGCDATIHLAAPGAWHAEDASTVADMVAGARNLLDVAAGMADHRTVIVSSTAAIDAADTPRLFDESSPFTIRDPTLVYAHAKHAAERAALAAFERGVPVVIVNPAEVYGPNDTALVTAGNLIDFATSNPVLVCDGGTSIVHVDDVAAGIVAALERGRPGERYILGGDNLTIRQLAELVVALRGRRATVLNVPNGLARGLSQLAIRVGFPLPYNPHVVPYATRYWFVDNTKARQQLGVRFRGARETIASTMDWLTSTGHLPHEAD